MHGVGRVEGGRARVTREGEVWSIAMGDIMCRCISFKSL